MTITLLSAGSNAKGQLGHSVNQDAYDFLPCTFLGSARGALPEGTTQLLDVAAGSNHTLALLERMEPSAGVLRRELWGCGDGRCGQLGSRYQKDVVTPPSDDLRPDSSGMALRTDVFRRLRLPFQEEGLESYEYKSIAAGWETSYVVLSSPDQRSGDVLLSFGSDDFGDLGIGRRDNAKGRSQARKGSMAKEIHRVRFDHLIVDGKALAETPISIQSVSASQHHVVVHIHAGGRSFLVGWGAARHGQIHNNGSSSDGSSKKAVSIIDRPQLIFIDDGEDPFLSCAVGSQHTIFLRSSRRLLGIGSNRKGQLQLNSLSNVTSVSCTWNGTFALTVGGANECSVYSAGSNAHGQLGGGMGVSSDSTPASSQPVNKVRFPEAIQGSTPSKLSCGTEHALMLWNKNATAAGGKEDSEVWGWGWNEHGNLGVGSTENVHEPVKVWPRSPTDGVATNIWAGCGTSWICCILRNEEKSGELS